MYLAVLKTRPHKYLLDIFLDKYLSIYFLADLQTEYFSPLLIFLSCLLDTYKNTHSCTNKHIHIKTQLGIRHLTLPRKIEVRFLLFLYVPIQPGTLPATSELDTSVKLIWNSLRLICLPLHQPWRPSKFISPSLGFNFTLRSFPWVYFGPFH